VANAALLEAALEQRNQAVNQDLVKTISHHLVQKNQGSTQLLPNAVTRVAQGMKSDQVDLEAKVEIEDHQHVLTPNAQKAVVKTNDQAGLETKAKTEDHQHVVLEMKGEVALTETKTMTADQRVQPGNLVVRIWLKAPKRGI
jgi:hypothetical protein